MITRRQLLTLAAGGSALALAGCGSDTALPGGPGVESATCVPRASLDRHTTLAGRPLVYEISEGRRAFWFDPDFHDQLERWYAWFVDTSGIAVPTRIWTYGSWIDGGTTCDSWHHAGRAFDLARLRRNGSTLVSCRHDQWRDADDLDLQRRRYWALAASLHHDFAYVLTYLYDDVHANHIHVDNGRSGPGLSTLSTLSTRSNAQVQAVQAICTYLWDTPVEITGDWDGATEGATRAVLDQLGVDDDLDDSQESWHAFLTASTARFPA